MSNPENSKQDDTVIWILVEGKRDREFFEIMIDRLPIEKMRVRSFDGIKNLKNFLRKFRRSADFDTAEKIGIVQDANGSFESAFQSVQESLRNTGFSVPGNAGEKSSGNPSVSVLILPDNKSDGALETLLWKTVSGTKIEECIDEYIDCVKGISDKKKKKSKAWRDKARAYSYIATRETPDISLRTSFEQGHWDLDHDALSIVRKFIRDLSDIE